jgi:hypothetical protein
VRIDSFQNVLIDEKEVIKSATFEIKLKHKKIIIFGRPTIIN